jgi:hypothetical protein
MTAKSGHLLRRHLRRKISPVTQRGANGYARLCRAKLDGKRNTNLIFIKLTK